MNEELYSYDKYRGFSIFINEDSLFYYGDIYFNGTQMVRGIKGISGESCLARCKSWVDSSIHVATEQDND